MKHLVLLSAAILIACSPSVEAGDTPEKPSPAAMSTGPTYEAPSTTGRYFDFVKSPSILIFSETRDWRHEEGIVGANLAIMKAAKEMGYGYFTTEHSAIFNAKDLEKFEIVVFNNMTGDALTPAQEAAFQSWLNQGKGTVLIHGAGDASHQDWEAYHTDILGATFVSHPMAPQFQEARIEVLAPSHPVMEGIGAEFTAIDEWYTFEAPPGDGFVVLAGLDESSYSPVNTVYGDRSDLRMGPKPQDHPIIWAKCHGDNQARSVFTAQGHRFETYDAKEASLILKNALNWTAKKTDFEGKGCSN